MGFKDWNPALTSMRDKVGWLLKNKSLWFNATDADLQHSLTDFFIEFTKKVRAAQLYRATTSDWTIWWLMTKKMRALKKRLGRKR